MIRSSLVHHLINWQSLKFALAILLEIRLVILDGIFMHRLLDHRSEMSDDECACGIQTAVEVNGGNDRFHRVGQKRAFFPALGQFFAFSDQKEPSDPQGPGDGCERRFGHNTALEF